MQKRIQQTTTTATEEYGGVSENQSVYGSSLDEPYEIGDKGSAEQIRTVITYHSPNSSQATTSNMAVTITNSAEAKLLAQSQITTFGSWNKGEKHDDIEAYLVGSQRKFVKYRLNIFVLNKCALRIQQSWFRIKMFKQRIALQAQAETEAKAQRQYLERQLLLEQQAFEAQKASIAETVVTRHIQNHSPMISTKTVEYGSVVNGQEYTGATTTSQFAIITEEDQNDAANYSSAQSQSMQTTMTKWGQQQVTQTSSAKRYQSSAEKPDIAKVQTNNRVTENTSVDSYVQNSRPDLASSVAQLQSTPSFKTTDMGENVEINKAFRQQTNKQQVNVSAYQSSVMRPKGSSPSYQSRQQNNTTSETTVTNTRSGSTLMASTAASKSRAAEVQNRKGSGTRRQQNTTVTKNMGGGATTTTTTTTTSYTTSRNGQVVGKSKSIDRSAIMRQQQRPKTTMKATSQNTTEVQKTQASSIVKSTSEIIKTKEAAVTEQQSAQAQSTSIISETKHRQSKVSTTPPIVERVSVTDAHDFINSYIKQGKPESLGISTLDDIKQQNISPSQSHIDNQRWTNEQSNTSSAQKQNALALVTESDLIVSGRPSLMNEDQNIALSSEQRHNLTVTNKTNSDLQQTNMLVISPTNNDLTNAYIQESQIDNQMRKDQNLVTFGTERQSPKIQEQAYQEQSTLYLNQNEKQSPTKSYSPVKQSASPQLVDKKIGGERINALQIEVELDEDSEQINLLQQEAVAKFDHTQRSSQYVSNQTNQSSPYQEEQESDEKSMGQRVIEQTWTQYQETKNLKESQDEISSQSLLKKSEARREERTQDVQQNAVIAERAAGLCIEKNQQKNIDVLGSPAREKSQGYLSKTTTSEVNQIQSTSNMTERISGQKWTEIQTQQVHQQQQQLQEKLSNPILSHRVGFVPNRTITKTTTTSQYQSQAKLPPVSNGIKTLDMKSVLSTAVIGNPQQSSRLQPTNTNFYDSNQKSTLDKTHVTEDCNTSRNEKLRSVSALSSKSTFSMEQKRVQNKQNLSSQMVAAKSFSRFQEINQRQISKNQNDGVTMITQSRRVDLSPGRSKGKQFSAYDKESIMNRQENSMRSLMQPTSSSKMKMRQKSKSRERSCDALPGDMSNTYHTYQGHEYVKKGGRQNASFQSNVDIMKTPESKLYTEQALASGRKSAFKSTSRLTDQTKSSQQKLGLATTTNQTTTTRTFVNGKEVSSKSETKTNKNHRPKSRSYINTPRTMTQQKQTENKVNLTSTSYRKRSPQQKTTHINTVQVSPRRTRNQALTIASNQSVNQQGRSQATNNGTKSSLKMTVHTFNQNKSQVMNDSPSTRKSQKSLQSGGNDQVMSGMISDDNSRMRTDGGNEVLVEEVNDISFPSQVYKEVRKKQASSFNATSSRQSQLSKQSHTSLSKLPVNMGTKTVVTNTTYQFKNVPSASEQRAQKRQQKQTELTGRQEDASVNEYATIDNSAVIERKGSNHTFIAAPMVNQGNQSQRLQLRSKQQSLNMMAQTTALRSPNLNKSIGGSTSSKHGEQQIFSEQQMKSKAIIGSDEKEATQIGYAGSQREVTQVKMTDQWPVEEQEGQDQRQQTQTTVFERVVDAEPIAFDIGSATGNSKKSDQVRFAKSPTFNQDEEQESERYQTINTVTEVTQQQPVVTVNEELQLNQIQIQSGEKSLLETEFKEDTRQHLLKCLNEDISFSKIQRSYRRDFKDVKEVLHSHYHNINAIFLYYSGQSHAYPGIAVEDFTSFAGECGILSNTLINEKTLIKCFSETTVSTNNYKKTGEKSLFRYEFLEILVRIAAFIQTNHQNQENLTLSQTLNALITDQILPSAQKVNRFKFRRFLIADQKVCELLARNTESLQACFDYFTHSKKKTVTLEECVALARQCQLDVPDQILGVVFAESLMTVIDTVRNKERMYQLMYPEFIYFLCKITEVHYTNTVHEMEEFYVKLDKMLPMLLEPFDLAPQFSFGVNFIRPCYKQEQLSNSKLTMEQQKQMRERLYIDDIIEGDDEDDVEVLEYQPSSTDNSRFGTKVNTSGISPDGIDGDIQAWPQPSPIAYPQRQEIIKSSPNQKITEETPEGRQNVVFTSEVTQQSNAGFQQMVQPEKHQIQVVERRSSRKSTNTSGGVKKSIVMNSSRGSAMKTSSLRTGQTMTTSRTGQTTTTSWTGPTTTTSWTGPTTTTSTTTSFKKIVPSNSQRQQQ